MNLKTSSEITGRWQLSALPGLVGLILLGVYLWMRDREWMAHIGDALPILAGIPLFFFFSRAIVKETEDSPILINEGDKQSGPLRHLPLFGLGALLAGTVLGINLLLALGWTALFWVWFAPQQPAGSHRRLARLLPLLLLSFPWLLQDGASIGWYFRLSGAWATASFYSCIGFTVERQGTLLLIQGVPIGVDAPCAGLNVLQALLLAGVALAQITPGGRRWSVLPLLTVLSGMAWLANVLRIILLGAAALTFGIPFARGFFHTFGGMAALVFMFLLCVLLFSRDGATNE